LGAIRPLSIDLKAVQFRPVTDRLGDKSPDFGVFAGKAELGAAWKTAGGAKTDALSIKRTDPSFPAAIKASRSSSTASTA